MKRQLMISTNILSNKLLPVREFQKVQNHLYSHVKKTHWYFVELQSNWKYRNTRFLVKYVPRCKKIWWNASSQSLSQCALLCGALSLVNELFVTILVCVKIYGRIRCETSSSKYNLVGQHLFSFLKQYLVHCTQAWDSFWRHRQTTVVSNSEHVWGDSVGVKELA